MDNSFWNTYSIYINRLNYEAEDLIWETIYEINDFPTNRQDEIIRSVYKWINYYNFISKTLGADSPRKKSYYKSIKDFFCYYYPEGKVIFKSLKKKVNPKSADKYDESGLKEYFDFCAKKLPTYIENVITDNPDDRHWSAVAVTGIIKSYIIISNQFSADRYAVDVRTYMLNHGFSEKDFEAFEDDRLKESVYYQGIQL